MRLHSPRIALVAASVAALVVAMLATAAGLTRDAGGAAAQPAPQVVVRTADDSAERANLAEVTKLVTRLPAELSADRTDSLTNKAAIRTSDVRLALPPDAVVVVDGASWRRTGGVGSMTVTVNRPAQPAARFLVVFVHQNNGWKLSETFAIGPA